MGWFLKKNSHSDSRLTELESVMERIDKRLVSVDFGSMEFPVEFVGDLDYKEIKGEWCSGDIRWKNEGFTDGSIIFRNLWRKGAWMDFHSHKAENEHIFMISGELRIRSGSSAMRSEHHLTPAYPYLRIEKKIPHEALALTDVEFLVVFEPYKNKENEKR